MLSAVERCVDEIARVRGEPIDLSRIPMDDARTFRAIRAADTTGAFQIESRAQMQMLPRTRPESLDDLTVQVALVRPGPIQGGAVHPYLERRERLRADPSFRIAYDHPSLEPILRDTLGTIVFQEQVIQVAMALARFSAGEAEGLRRAMSRKRSEKAILAYRGQFIEGATKRGVATEVAERVFEQIRGFSGFGFPKAHAVAFGLLAYQSTWLRVHYGPEFLCSLLNEQPMGFYPPDALVHEAQRRGIEVLPPDVNRSGVECAVEDGAVRVGLGYITGLREQEARELVAERERRGAYEGLADLASRSGVGRDGLERLAWAGACEALGGRGALRRREDLWQLGVARAAAGGWRGARDRTGARPALPPPPHSRRRPPCASWIHGSGWSPTTRRRGSRSPSTRWRSCGPSSSRVSRRAPGSERIRRRRRGSRSRGWWSPGSGRRRREGWSSCCSRTSWGRSTWSSCRRCTRAIAWRSGRRRS